MMTDPIVRSAVVTACQTNQYTFVCPRASPRPNPSWLLIGPPPRSIRSRTHDYTGFGRSGVRQNGLRPSLPASHRNLPPGLVETGSMVVTYSDHLEGAPPHGIVPQCSGPRTAVTPKLSCLRRSWISLLGRDIRQLVFRETITVYET